jgi:hypothetical protein
MSMQSQPGPDRTAATPFRRRSGERDGNPSHRPDLTGRRPGEEPSTWKRGQEAEWGDIIADWPGPRAAVSQEAGGVTTGHRRFLFARHHTFLPIAGANCDGAMRNRAIGLGHGRRAYYARHVRRGMDGHNPAGT